VQLKAEGHARPWRLAPEIFIHRAGEEAMRRLPTGFKSVAWHVRGERP